MQQFNNWDHVHVHARIHNMYNIHQTGQWSTIVIYWIFDWNEMNGTNKICVSIVAIRCFVLLSTLLDLCHRTNWHDEKCHSSAQQFDGNLIKLEWIMHKYLAVLQPLYDCNIADELYGIGHIMYWFSLPTTGHLSCKSTQFMHCELCYLNFAEIIWFMRLKLSNTSMRIDAFKSEIFSVDFNSKSHAFRMLA